MSTISNKKNNARKTLVVMFSIILSTFIGTNKIPVQAQDTAPILSRADMMNIARQYASFRWFATADNVLNPPYRYYNEVVNTESSYAWLLDLNNNIRKLDIDPNDPNTYTPITKSMLEETPIDTPDWWTSDGVTENVGIPYAWGGSTTIDAINLPTTADLGRSFLDKINNGYPAGDISTSNTEGSGTLTNGVDCNGFINNVWRMGARFGMDDMEDMTRPIKFRDLRPGDILMNYVDNQNTDSHVMLFKGFVNYNPANGEPTPGTQFQVYEASGPAEKVREYTYTIGNITSITLGNQDPRNWARGNDQLSDETSISGLPGNYIPRTYVNPISVVLVIDRSGSMNETQNPFPSKIDQVKYAARMFVDLLRPGDQISIVSFNSGSTVNYPLQIIDTSVSVTKAVGEIEELI